MRFICEVDDCFELATTFVQGRLLCAEHALPYIRKPEQLKTVEPAQAEWLLQLAVACDGDVRRG